MIAIFKGENEEEQKGSDDEIYNIAHKFFKRTSSKCILQFYSSP